MVRVIVSSADTALRVISPEAFDTTTSLPVPEAAAARVTSLTSVTKIPPSSAVRTNSSTSVLTGSSTVPMLSPAVMVAVAAVMGSAPSLFSMAPEAVSVRSAVPTSNPS